MSGHIEDTLNGSPPTDKDKNVLRLIFGDETCVRDPTELVVWNIGFAIIATLLFIVLAFPYQQRFNTTPQYYNYYIGIRAVGFFILILLLDWLFARWKGNRKLCKHPLEIGQF